MSPDHVHYRVNLKQKVPIVPTESLEDNKVGIEEFSPPSFGCVPFYDLGNPAKDVSEGIALPLGKLAASNSSSSITPPPSAPEVEDPTVVRQKDREHRLYIHGLLHLFSEKECPGCDAVSYTHLTLPTKRIV